MPRTSKGVRTPTNPFLAKRKVRKIEDNPEFLWDEGYDSEFQERFGNWNIWHIIRDNENDGDYYMIFDDHWEDGPEGRYADTLEEAYRMVGKSRKSKSSFEKRKVKKGYSVSDGFSSETDAKNATLIEELDEKTNAFVNDILERMRDCLTYNDIVRGSRSVENYESLKFKLEHMYSVTEKYSNAVQQVLSNIDGTGMYYEDYDSYYGYGDEYEASSETAQEGPTSDVQAPQDDLTDIEKRIAQKRSGDEGFGDLEKANDIIPPINGKFQPFASNYRTVQMNANPVKPVQTLNPNKIRRI